MVCSGEGQGTAGKWESGSATDANGNPSSRGPGAPHSPARRASRAEGSCLGSGAAATPNPETRNRGRGVSPGLVGRMNSRQQPPEVRLRGLACRRAADAHPSTGMSSRWSGHERPAPTPSMAATEGSATQYGADDDRGLTKPRLFGGTRLDRASTQVRERRTLGTPVDRDVWRVRRSVWRIPQSLRAFMGGQVRWGRSIGMTSCAQAGAVDSPSPLRSGGEGRGTGRGRGPTAANRARSSPPAGARRSAPGWSAPRRRAPRPPAPWPSAGPPAPPG